MGQEHADMIHGIGTDIVVIDRIAEILTRHGDRFINRIYTDLEQKAADSRRIKPGFMQCVCCKRSSLESPSRQQGH